MLLLNMKSLIVNCLAEDVMFPECQIPIIIINNIWSILPHFKVAVKSSLIFIVYDYYFNTKILP